MENKKTKLTISGGPKKSFKNIDSANNQGKKTVIISKQPHKLSSKGKFPKVGGYKTSSGAFKKGDNLKNNYRVNNTNLGISDFEKRKLAEQRATKRFKGEDDKDKKSKTSSLKKRDVKLTVSRALSDEIETRERSLASVKRARQKELKNINKEDNGENQKPIKRNINIPEAITVRELANKMAEQSSNVIKHLFGMGVTVTINQTLAADTAEYLVKEFGHNPIREEKA